MEFLDIKSFKRKHPDLTRRAVDPNEREYIKEWGPVSETQADLGLTAIPAVEIHDLMAQEYPDRYLEYQKVMSERTKQEIVARHEELKTIQSDSKKLAELRQKSLLAASEWNNELNRERRKERRGFWDVQTMRIQRPCGAKRVCYETNYGAYPAALIAGQFQEHYVKFTPDQLKKLPLKTAVNPLRILPLKRTTSPQPVLVSESEIAKETVEAGAEGAEVKKPASNPDMAPLGARGDKTEEHCAFCESDIYKNDKYVECIQCGSCGHPTCMEMSSAMYETVKAYDWMCMECKPCSVCANLDEEDKMMFCDLCDRGYHTFCVGLEDLPTGRWVCQKFCGGKRKADNASGNSGSDGPETNRALEKCKQCGRPLTRETKVHHRSKFRHSGLCNDCASSRLS